MVSVQVNLLHVDKNISTHVNKGQELLAGLVVGDDDCMEVKGSSSHHCGAYGGLAMKAC